VDWIINLDMNHECDDLTISGVCRGGHRDG